MLALLIAVALAADHPVRDAVWDDDLPALQALPALDLRAPDKDGYTALHFATLYGRPDLVAWLVAQQVPVDAVNQSGRTPLQLAAEMGCSPCIAPLLAAGADVSRTTEHDETVLHKAVWKADLDAVRQLVAAGAPLEAQDHHGETPLIDAASHRRWDVVEVLHGAGARYTTPRGGTALYHAALQGDVDRIRALLPHVPPDAGKREETPLLAAARVRQAAAVRALLDAGATVDARGFDGWTALHHAASNDDLESARALLAAGADPRATERNGRTPLYWAVFGARPGESHVYLDLGEPHSTHWFAHGAPNVLPVLLALAPPTPDERAALIAHAEGLWAHEAAAVLRGEPIPSDPPVPPPDYP